MTREAQARTEAFTAVATGWHEAGIRYGIVNGYLENEEELGRDLDIVMDRQHLALGNNLAVATLKNLGWKIRQDQRPWAWWIFGFKFQDGEVLGLEIDLLPRLQSGFNCIQDGVSSFTCPAGIHGWQVDPRGSLIKRIILQLVAGNFSKFDRSPDLLELNDMERHVIENDYELRRLLADTILLDDSKFPTTHLRPLKSLLKRRLYERALIRPFKAMEAGIFGLTRSLMLNPFARQVCPVLSISATAGIDKNRVIEILSEKMQKATFLKPVILGLNSRPPSQAPVPRSTPNGECHPSLDERSEKPPLATNGFQILGLLVEHWLKTKFVVNRKSVRLFPVVYAGHPVHMLIDPDSYGIAEIPKWLPKCMPKAPLSIILVGEEDPIQSPRGNRHYSIYELTSLGLIDAAVDMKNGPEHAAGRIFEIVLAQFLDMKCPSGSTK